VLILGSGHDIESGEKLMHRKLVVVAVVGLFAALIVPAALAGKPTIQRVPFEDHYVSLACGFPVQLDATGTALDISYTDELGNFHDFQAGPQVKQTMTNLVTGKTIVVNISGPGSYTFGVDGGFTLVGTGNWSWGRVNPANLAPGIFLTQGRFVLSVSGAGVRTFTSTGTTTNLCAQLA
jgi:hypothetical protein